jgi:putative PIN family toxin of toxin-antitoxin system
VRIVVDTNVVVSGAFFSGPPSRILDACFAGQHQMVVSPDILEEYYRVGSEFNRQRPNADFDRFLTLILGASVLVEAAPAASQICADPDDDKFLHCALAAGATHVISGDRHLLTVSGYGGVQVVRPREFLEKYVTEDD